jgi:hypothetical protein
MAHHKLAMWKWGSTSLLVPRTVSHSWKPSTTRSITPCTGRMMLPRCWLLSGLVDLFKIALLESTIFLRIILRIIECLYLAKEKERKSKSRERMVVYIVFCPCSPESYMLPQKHLLWLSICYWESVIIKTLNILDLLGSCFIIRAMEWSRFFTQLAHREGIRRGKNPVIRVVFPYYWNTPHKWYSTSIFYITVIIVISIENISVII